MNDKVLMPVSGNLSTKGKLDGVSTTPTLIFNATKYARWVEPRRAVHFAASAGGAVITFLVSEEALAFYLNPVSDKVLSNGLSLAAFKEFEPSLQRIARRCHKSASVSKNPIFIGVEEVRADSG